MVQTSEIRRAGVRRQFCPLPARAVSDLLNPGNATSEVSRKRVRICPGSISNCQYPLNRRLKMFRGGNFAMVARRDCVLVLLFSFLAGVDWAREHIA